jgi:hypothetical protein
MEKPVQPERPATTQAQTDWENEGGSSAPEPKQVTKKGYEFPVPSRESIFAAFKKIAKPKK